VVVVVVVVLLLLLLLLDEGVASTERLRALECVEGRRVEGSARDIWGRLVRLLLLLDCGGW
jgi:hypothetical protein